MPPLRFFVFGPDVEADVHGGFDDLAADVLEAEKEVSLRKMGRSFWIAQ